MTGPVLRAATGSLSPTGLRNRPYNAPQDPWRAFSHTRDTMVAPRPSTGLVEPLNGVPYRSVSDDSGGWLWGTLKARGRGHPSRVSGAFFEPQHCEAERPLPYLPSRHTTDRGLDDLSNQRKRIQAGARSIRGNRLEISAAARTNAVLIQRQATRP